MSGQAAILRQAYQFYQSDDDMETYIAVVLVGVVVLPIVLPVVVGYVKRELNWG